jgi:hypothetical protein
MMMRILATSGFPPIGTTRRKIVIYAIFNIYCNGKLWHTRLGDAGMNGHEMRSYLIRVARYPRKIKVRKTKKIVRPTPYVGL